jgi:glucose/arabinose dehydrogenase
MRRRWTSGAALAAVALGALLLGPAGARGGSLSGPIANLGLTVEIEDVVTIPPSSPSAPRARLNVLREAPDGSGRLFVNDLRGKLHVLDAGVLDTYFDLAVLRPALRTGPGIGAGLVSFDFHPEFATNGLLYTVHTENPGAIPPNLGPALPTSIVQHAVLTEWEADDPSANAFSGTSRELIRVASLGNDHNLGEIAFRPGAEPGDEDYGLLYLGAGDYSSTFSGQPEQVQRLDTPYGALLRIDPLGGPFVRGGITYPYGIPPSNPFVDDPDPATLGEIYAYGFRNAHRLTWDTGFSEALLVSDIGEAHFEEVNVVQPGDNCGWNLREGTYRIDPLDPATLLPLPPDDASFGFTYPAAQYDHEEGRAIAGGFVYRGTAIPALQGEFVLGDIVNGRLFYTDVTAVLAADDGDPATTAPLYELNLQRAGAGTSLLALVRETLGNPNASRTDLRFGTDLEGRIYVTTKQDGVVRRLAPLPPPACADGLDNDGDSLVDYPQDPGCGNAGSMRENPQCQDGVNNDPGQDTLIDFDGGLSATGTALTAPDLQCLGQGWRNREAKSSSSRCGGGAGLVLLLPPLFWLRRRASGSRRRDGPAPPAFARLRLAARASRLLR